jgi:uncharacterized membrane protein
LLPGLRGQWLVMTAAAADHLPDSTPSVSAGAPALVRLVQQLERSGALDRLAGPLGTLSSPAGKEPLQRVLLGRDVGHALHPFLTDLPIGFWTSSLVLDLLGHRTDGQASRRLLTAGLAAAVPAAATGLAEWRQTSRPETRVASTHGTLNVVALGLYAGSLATQRRSPRLGLGLKAAGTAVTALSGFLGGHLVVARRTGSRHPAYRSDGTGPVLARPGANAS